MGKKLFRTGLIRVKPNYEVDLEPIHLIEERRGVIHGVVQNAANKVCVAKLFKVKLNEKKDADVTPVDFQYLDDLGQFLFPVTDTEKDIRYFIKIFCLDPFDTIVDPIGGNCSITEK